MTDRIITREISAHHAWQGPESEAPAFCNDGPQLAALAEVGIPSSGDLISREAAIEIARGAAMAHDQAGGFVSKVQGATAATIANRIRALPAQGQPVAPAVKVKPLVWSKDGAALRSGDYTINCEDGAYEVDFHGEMLASVGLNSCTQPLCRAMREAYEHHEARILSALEGAQ